MLNQTILHHFCFTAHLYQQQSLSDRAENTMRGGIFFYEIRGVWITDETLSECLIYILKRKNPRSKRRSKIVKLYAN